MEATKGVGVSGIKYVCGMDDVQTKDMSSGGFVVVMMAWARELRGYCSKGTSLDVIRESYI